MRLAQALAPKWASPTRSAQQSGQELACLSRPLLWVQVWVRLWARPVTHSHIHTRTSMRHVCTHMRNTHVRTTRTHKHTFAHMDICSDGPFLWAPASSVRRSLLDWGLSVPLRAWLLLALQWVWASWGWLLLAGM